MAESKYRQELRDHFYGKMWTTHLTSTTGQQLKEQVLRTHMDNCRPDPALDFTPRSQMEQHSGRLPNSCHPIMQPCSVHHVMPQYGNGPAQQHFCCNQHMHPMYTYRPYQGPFLQPQTQCSQHGQQTQRSQQSDQRQSSQAAQQKQLGQQTQQTKQAHNDAQVQHGRQAQYDAQSPHGEQAEFDSQHGKQAQAQHGEEAQNVPQSPRGKRAPYQPQTQHGQQTLRVSCMQQAQQQTHGAQQEQFAQKASYAPNDLNRNSPCCTGQAQRTPQSQIYAQPMLSGRRNACKESSMSKNQPPLAKEPGDAAGADALIYSNADFCLASSNDSNDSEIEYNTKQPNEAPRYSSFLMSARAHRKAMDARFNAKFPLHDKSLYYTDSESTGGTKKTGQSVQTVISAKSGHDLRSVVRSQIEIQQALNKSISHLNDLSDNVVLQLDNATPVANTNPPTIALSPTGRETPVWEKRYFAPSIYMEKPSKSNKLELSSPKATSASSMMNDLRSAGISVSVDDIVSSKVIGPMIRKIQRMYLNNLKEEMVLMEDLERVPSLVSEVYRKAGEQWQKR